VLEFPKLTALLANQACTDGGRRLLAALVPSNDADEVRVRQARSRELSRVLDAGAAPPSLVGIADFRNALRQGRVDRTALAPLDLRCIADTLRTASQVRQWLDAQQSHLPEVC
jgi:dsDNA-specific endonuclease/ATPase MutS2